MFGNVTVLPRQPPGHPEGLETRAVHCSARRLWLSQYPPESQWIIDPAAHLSDAAAFLMARVSWVARPLRIHFLLEILDRFFQLNEKHFDIGAILHGQLVRIDHQRCDDIAPSEEDFQ